jgi:hypothetical protein
MPLLKIWGRRPTADLPAEQNYKDQFNGGVGHCIDLILQIFSVNPSLRTPSVRRVFSKSGSRPSLGRGAAQLYVLVLVCRALCTGLQELGYCENNTISFAIKAIL